MLKSPTEMALEASTKYMEILVDSGLMPGTLTEILRLQVRDNREILGNIGINKARLRMIFKPKPKPLNRRETTS
jgi:hypothetical protein